MRNFTPVLGIIVCAIAYAAESSAPSVNVGEFPQEVRTAFTEADGLPSSNVTAVALTSDGKVYAGTDKGLAVFDGAAWAVVPGVGGPITALASTGSAILAATSESFYRIAGAEAAAILKAPGSKIAALAPIGEGWLFGDADGVSRVDTGSNELSLPNQAGDVRDIAVAKDGVTIFVATENGLYTLKTGDDAWVRLSGQDKLGRSWLFDDVRGVAIDTKGRLWVVSPQGAAMRDGAAWTLLTGLEGLPFNDFTSVSAAEDGAVWMGTSMGAIKFDGQTWEYRQGQRWLPDDVVNDIAVDKNGNAWFATSAGVSVIERQPITLAEKAAHFEEQIDKYHRRTPYEYVLGVGVEKPGDPEKFRQSDSDNDGLWTGMYGAGECYAYAATKDPKAKERATKAFKALAFLSEVTQGGSNPAPPGFPARTILPTSGHNPNEGRLEGDKREQAQGDYLWKVIDPRWPVDASGEWYWKTDTSSDELDGHYFLYALYYDLVAETDEEKEHAREVVRRVTDHLIEHGFYLVDHDGKPTRWAQFGPENLNHDMDWWEQRGLNSLEILSYLTVANHVVGDPKYAAAKQRLIEEEHYMMNVMNPKVQYGPGSGNQSDDEMAFMGFYNIIRLEPDPELKKVWQESFWRYWRIEEPERNPLFNFMFAAVNWNATTKNPFVTWDLAPYGDWLDDAVDSLKRYPLDRFDWTIKNSHRLDIVPLEQVKRYENEHVGKGHMRNGKVLPIDERYVGHWNHDPWSLNYGGAGHGMADGASYLLPYYMGLYHGFIK